MPHTAGITERMKMKINSMNFRLRPGEKVKLKERLAIEQPSCNRNQIKGVQNAEFKSMKKTAGRFSSLTSVERW